ncbi:MAG: type II toxin-antitoxin system death-on-curing family toxin [Clostridia bacterium]|nr:type II toxin-antitoxin system death-on-curing family toxin [Clostridia bacterium]
MVKFNKRSILLLQQKIYEHTGQKILVRDYELLDSAIESPFQTFDGCELYPSTEEKGARLCFNIINNHPFIDGNKRMGVLAMLCFFEINNISLKYSNQDLIEIGLAIASGKKGYEELVAWTNAHKKNKQEQCERA